MGLDISEIKPYVDRDIQKHGWGIICSEGENPSYLVTVGLHQSINSPEIVCIGLDIEASHKLLNSIALSIKAGRKIKVRTPYEDIVKDVPLVFIDVDRKNRSPYLDVPEAYYQSKALSAYQLVWPDLNNKFPWESEYDTSFSVLQPILNENIKEFGMV